jgi:trimeric autotransporter adhesin
MSRMSISHIAMLLAIGAIVPMQSLAPRPGLAETLDNGNADGFAAIGISDSDAGSARATAIGGIAIGPESFALTKDATHPCAGGSDATDCGHGNIAIGISSQATNDFAVAVGFVSKAGGLSSSAYGPNSASPGQGSSAFGANANAVGNGSVAAGSSATANGLISIAIGFSSSAADAAVALGSQANARANNTIAMGQGSAATGTRSFAAGTSANSAGNESIAIGTNASTLNPATRVGAFWSGRYRPVVSREIRPQYGRRTSGQCHRR